VEVDKHETCAICLSPVGQIQAKVTRKQDGAFVAMLCFKCFMDGVMCQWDLTRFKRTPAPSIVPAPALDRSSLAL